MPVSSQTALGVTVVFVTMNRRDIALICLNKLRAQTRRPGKVIVVNNASTDSTRSMLLEASSQSNGWIVVMDLVVNIGNAGGMQVAMEAAFASDSQAVWVLDDDSWPEPDALERLLDVKVPTDSVISCRVVDLATGHLSWPLQTPMKDGWQLVGPEDPLPPGEVVQIRRSWLGALISRKIYETVGPVEGRLFLRGEDEDYPRRIERAGFPVFMITSSLLHHPPAGRLNMWEFAGRTVVLESGLIGDKLYYRLRNAWWMTRRDRGTFEAMVMVILHGLALLRWEPPMCKWLPVWWEAVLDAFQDRLGPRNDPSSRGDLH